MEVMMQMQSYIPWIVAAALVVVVAVVQWQVMSRMHLKALAAERLRYQRAQQSAAAQQRRLAGGADPGSPFRQD